jgi:hypothetical protein
MISYTQYVKESGDPLSGRTNDIKIDVEGKESGLLNKLIENLSMVVKKRKLRNITIKSIKGHINRKTFLAWSGYVYDTYLEINLSNKDVIIAEYKSITSNILIKVNGTIIFDLNYKAFDNEVLIDRIISEYIKYLQEKNFTIKEK